MKMYRVLCDKAPHGLISVKDSYAAIKWGINYVHHWLEGRYGNYHFHDGELIIFYLLPQDKHYRELVLEPVTFTA